MSYKTYQVRVHHNGSEHWYLNDKRHRENGPAITYEDGTQEWWINNQLHREDGPAVIHANGTEFWYLNGKLHREDGPAIMYANGVQSWYLEGRFLSEKEFNTRKQSCKDKIVEIDGKKYQLKEM